MRDAEEEVKRFEKCFSKCRTCSHIMMAHTFVFDKKGICMDVKENAKKDYNRCPCHTFIPADNLEFLEWAAQKKEQEKRNV